MTQKLAQELTHELTHNARLPALEWAMAEQRRASSAKESPSPTPAAHVPLPHAVQVEPPAPLREALAGQPEATLQHILAQMFERVTGLAESLDWWWSAASPAPAALAELAQMMGLDPSLHDNDSCQLSRLRVMLPSWRQRRGEVARVKELLEELDYQKDAAWLSPPGPGRVCVSISRRANWVIGADREPRIEQGVLVQGAQQRTPDRIHLYWIEDAPLPIRALRLLPVWMDVELVRHPGGEL